MISSTYAQDVRLIYTFYLLYIYSFLHLQRRNDREEIRRRLAMGPDAEDLRAERGRKPSLQSRLQSGSYRSKFYFYLLRCGIK